MRKTNINNKVHRKAIEILGKYMTKAELKGIRDSADLWYIFDEAIKEVG